MIKEQTIEIIPVSDLVERVRRCAAEGWRLVQINATTLAHRFEVNYSFDRDYVLLTLRIELSLEQPAVPSVSGVYLSAFLYENEIHDLWGIQINGIAVDYKGTFYRTTVKMPFGATKMPKEAA